MTFHKLTILMVVLSFAVADDEYPFKPFYGSALNDPSDPFPFVNYPIFPKNYLAAGTLRNTNTLTSNNILSQPGYRLNINSNASDNSSFNGSGNRGSNNNISSNIPTTYRGPVYTLNNRNQTDRSSRYSNSGNSTEINGPFMNTTDYGNSKITNFNMGDYARGGVNINQGDSYQNVYQSQRGN